MDMEATCLAVSNLLNCSVIADMDIQSTMVSFQIMRQEGEEQ